MSEIIYSFENRKVRTIYVDNQIAFCLSDALLAINSNTKVTDAEKAIIEGLGEEFVNNEPLQTNGS